MTSRENPKLQFEEFLKRLSYCLGGAEDWEWDAMNNRFVFDIICSAEKPVKGGASEQIVLAEYSVYSALDPLVRGFEISAIAAAWVSEAENQRVQVSPESQYYTVFDLG